MPSSFNLADYVLRAGLDVPQKTALEVLGGPSLTYGALRAAVLGTAAGLRARELNPGDRVLLRLGNTPDFPIAYLGAIAAGLVAVPTSAALTVPEVERIIAVINPAAVLRDPAVACPEVETISVDTLRAMRNTQPADMHLGDPERHAYIVFTSGTSGQPRAVVHAHRAILARRMMFDGWYGLKPDDRLLHAGAFNWTFTLGTGLMDPWTVGATALIPAKGTRPADLPGLLATHRATLFAAAPGVYRQALRGDVPPMPNLRHGLSAGEKLPDSVRTDWEAATGTPVFEAFGMSEISTFISSAPGRPAAAGTLGTPQPGRRVAILGEDGPLPAGTPGVIAIHRSDPGLMLGYLGAEEETKARYRGDWFITGDQAVADDAGHITYLGRADDMMNAGGFRVSPVEVEDAMNRHPQITQAAAIEVPTPSGARVIAVCYTAPEALDTAALSAYAQTCLARYKQPRIYRHVPRLPLGPNGKLRRQALRDEWSE